MKKAQCSSRHNRGSLALYSVFSALLMSSMFLLFTTYSAGIGSLTTSGQEQFRVSLLAGRISNLIRTAEHQGIVSETALDTRFLLYGARPANYTMASSGDTLLIRSGSAEATIRTTGANVSLEELGRLIILRVSRQ